MIASKKKICHSFIPLISFFQILFFSFSCTSPNNPPSLITRYSITREESDWMAKFFDDLLFDERAVFTLWGSKPMTEIILYHYSEEEMALMFENLTKEELENCYINYKYDLPENWEKWEKTHSRFPIKKYLLFRSHFSDDKKVSFVYFVDILKSASIIQDNYNLFRKSVGMDFHPLEAVLEMPNAESSFWKKVRSSEDSALLWGILFGYGKVNACAYHWKYFDTPESCKEFLQSFSSHSSNPPPSGQVQITAKKFNTPSFVSFIDQDEMIQTYNNEREKIRAIYQDKNRLNLTLEKLLR